MGWKWYPEADKLVPQDLVFTTQTYSDVYGSEWEYEIPLDSFDARKLRFFYTSDLEMKFGPEFDNNCEILTDDEERRSCIPDKLWTEEQYN